MKLAAWLKKEGKTGSDLARRIGRDGTTINRLIPKPGKKQTRKPSYELAADIAAATGGEVTLNDFMDEFPERDPAQGNVSAPGDPSEATENSAHAVSPAHQRKTAA